MIKIKRLHNNATIPRRSTDGAAGLDLYACEHCTIWPGASVLIPSGIAIQMPDGWHGQIWPRSGLATRHSLDTLAGIIDSDYVGEIKISLINHGDRPIEIKRGDRIAQLIVVPQYRYDPIEVDELDDTERGVHGFGSTGY